MTALKYAIDCPGCGSDSHIIIRGWGKPTTVYYCPACRDATAMVSLETTFTGADQFMRPTTAAWQHRDGLVTFR